MFGWSCHYIWSSPHAWGCFSFALALDKSGSVFPTCVGVFLNTKDIARIAGSLPHMRGGVSAAKKSHQQLVESSPHAWGCFYPVACLFAWCEVFPTCVGVFLLIIVSPPPRYCLPHMRGGVSHRKRFFLLITRSSPHAWGCFHIHQQVKPFGEVFPTCVGVFPSVFLNSLTPACLPHMRGGVSSSHGANAGPFWSSPHAWGCFLPESMMLLR